MKLNYIYMHKVYSNFTILWTSIVLPVTVIASGTLHMISILTLEGRECITIKYGEYRSLDMNRVRGQAYLIYHNNTFYLW